MPFNLRMKFTSGRPQIDTSGKVGTSLPCYDGEKFVLGERPYIDDVKFPGMLYGALLLSHILE